MMTSQLRFSPASALVGAVLHLPAPGAAAALSLVVDEDLADVQLITIAAVARELAEDGVAPDPTVVLGVVRRRALATGEALRRLALRLLEVHANCAVPASARWYAAAVLDEALRRRCTELSTRIAQAAEAESLRSLLALVDAEHQAVKELADRRAAIADDPPARLQKVVNA